MLMLCDAGPRKVSRMNATAECASAVSRLETSHHTLHIGRDSPTLDTRLIRYRLGLINNPV